MRRLLPTSRLLRLLTLLTAPLGCSADVASPAEWEYGPPAEYAVSGVAPRSLPDPVSGGTFYVPEGGEGTLSVAPILSGPLTLPEDGRAFGMSYVGTGAFELRLPRAADSATTLEIAGAPDHSTYDPVSEAGAWIPVAPDDPATDPVVFELAVASPPGAGVEFARRAAGMQTATYYLQAAARSIQSIEAEYLEFVRLDRELEQVIEGLVGKLPTALQTQVRAATAAGAPMHRHASVLGSEISSYVGFRRYWYSPTARHTYPYFTLVARGPLMATRSTLAHEAGHYLSHLILGDETFDLLEGQLRKGHDIGEVDDARPLLEEYAQFADQVVNGDLRRTIDWDLLEPITALRSATTSGPRGRNWPGVEAYGAALMTNLTRTTDVLTEGLSGDPEEIPALGWSVTDVFALLAAHEPLTVDQLRAAIALELGQRGRLDALPALLERTGWSYHGHGRVKDARGNPVVGATVQSVCKVASEGGREYLTPPDPVTTDNGGVFTLERVFPMDTALRVTVGGVVRDLPLSVDPFGKTNVDLDLGEFVLGDASFDKFRFQVDVARRWDEVIEVPGEDRGPPSSLVDTYLWGDTAAMTVGESSLDIAFAATRSEYGSVYTLDLTLRPCTLAAGGAEIARCQVRAVSDGSWTRTFDLVGLPRTVDRPDERVYACERAACAGYLENLVEVYESKDPSGAVLGRWQLAPGSLDWTSDEVWARISLRLYK